jgi:small ligand-binding sensory domain FIST
VILAGSGLSEKRSAAEAGREAAHQALSRLGGHQTAWGLVFATPFYEEGFETMLEGVVETLGTDRLSGCSGLGVVTEAGEVEGRPGVAVLAVASDQIHARPFLVGVPESPDPFGGDPADLLVLTPDPGRLREAAARGLFGGDEGSLTVVGAMSASVSSETAQFLGGRVATASISGIRLGGRFAHRVGVTQGCAPLGGALTVSEGEGGLISRLDGDRATDALMARVPRLLSEDPERLAGRLFLAVPPTGHRLDPAGRDYLVRPILAMDMENGGIAASFPVEEGMEVLPVVREADAARDDLRAMLQRIDESSSGDDRFGLYFSCCARGRSLYGVDGVDSGYIAGTLEGLPIVGFFGNGEIAPLAGRSHLFAYTGVLSVVSET